MPLGPFRVEYIIPSIEVPQKAGYKRKARLLNAPKVFDIAVAGTSYRQDDLMMASRQLQSRGVKRIFESELVYENNNKHDRLAVACYIEGRHIGYLPAVLCQDFRTAMAPNIPSGMRDIPLLCPALFVGGGREQYIGVRLDLPKSRRAAVAKKRKAQVPIGGERELMGNQ